MVSGFRENDLSRKTKNHKITNYSILNDRVVPPFQPLLFFKIFFKNWPSIAQNYP